MKTYKINEIFYSIQGEGARAGTANIFLRFSDCNLTCSFCDTEFRSGTEMSKAKILLKLSMIAPDCKWIIMTGGEPALQVDSELTSLLISEGYQLAIETNGSKKIDGAFHWITVSPKVSEHVIKRNFSGVTVNELKYVLAKDQPIPQPQIEAHHKFLSPMNDGDQFNSENLKHCIKLIKENPEWRLTMQYHKLWRVR